MKCGLKSISKGGIEETGAMMPQGNTSVHFFFLISGISIAYKQRHARKTDLIQLDGAPSPGADFPDRGLRGARDRRKS